MREAVAKLRKGLDVLVGLPDGRWRWQQELDLQTALGAALTATHGRELGETLARARMLTEQLDRPEYLTPLLVGQWAFRSLKAEHRLSLAPGEALETLGGVGNDAVAQSLSYLLQGTSFFFLGESVAARAFLERCTGLADAALTTTVRASYRSLPYDAHDPRPRPGMPGLH